MIWNQKAETLFASLSVDEKQKISISTAPLLPVPSNICSRESGDMHTTNINEHSHSRCIENPATFSARQSQQYSHPVGVIICAIVFAQQARLIPHGDSLLPVPKPASIAPPSTAKVGSCTAVSTSAQHGMPLNQSLSATPTTLYRCQLCTCSTRLEYSFSMAWIGDFIFSSRC